MVLGRVGEFKVCLSGSVVPKVAGVGPSDLKGWRLQVLKSGGYHIPESAMESLRPSGLSAKYCRTNLAAIIFLILLTLKR